MFSTWIWALPASLGSVPDISLLCSFSSRQRFKFLVCVEGLLEGPLIPLSICGLCRLDVGFQMAAWAEMFPPLSSPTFLFPCWSFPSEASNSAIRLTCWDITISMSYKMAKAESSDEKIEESLQRSKSLWSCHQTLSLPFESPQQMPFIWRWPGSFRSL